MAKTDDIRNTNLRFHAHENEMSSSEQTKINHNNSSQITATCPEHIVSIA